jgi:hypothetical protein
MICTYIFVFRHGKGKIVSQLSASYKAKPVVAIRMTYTAVTVRGPEQQATVARAAASLQTERDTLATRATWELRNRTGRPTPNVKGTQRKRSRTKSLPATLTGLPPLRTEWH